jgi:transcriptional antiterminator RfaH
MHFGNILSYAIGVPSDKTPTLVLYCAVITSGCIEDRRWRTFMPWSLLLTAPNVEKRVCSRLTDLRYEHLFIRQRCLRVRHGRKVETFTAAFPRYIFVTVHDAWETIRNIAGVLDFVRIGTEPARISESIIVNLRTRLDRNGILPFQEKSKFAFGQRVMICSNLIERRAIFQYALPHNRACVMQEWFGTFRNVEIDQDDLLLIEAFNAIKRSRRTRKQEQRQRRCLTIPESHGTKSLVTTN